MFKTNKKWGTYRVSKQWWSNVFIFSFNEFVLLLFLFRCFLVLEVQTPMPSPFLVRPLRINDQWNACSNKYFLFFYLNYFLLPFFIIFLLHVILMPFIYFLLNVVCNFVHGSKRTQQSRKCYSYYDHMLFFPKMTFQYRWFFEWFFSTYYEKWLKFSQ